MLSLLRMGAVSLELAMDLGSGLSHGSRDTRWLRQHHLPAQLLELENGFSCIRWPSHYLGLELLHSSEPEECARAGNPRPWQSERGGSQRYPVLLRYLTILSGSR